MRIAHAGRHGWASKRKGQPVESVQPAGLGRDALETTRRGAGAASPRSAGLTGVPLSGGRERFGGEVSGIMILPRRRHQLAA